MFDGFSGPTDNQQHMALFQQGTVDLAREYNIDWRRYLDTLSELWNVKWLCFLSAEEHLHVIKH